jgi:phage-related protein
MQEPEPKPVDWIGSSYKDFCDFSAGVQDAMGYALYQIGKMHESAKPLKGFGGAGVVEIVEDFRTDTYRAIYTVKFSDVVYVLHAFKKKSKKGRETPRHEIELIKRRLNLAEAHARLRRSDSNGQ